METLGLSLLFVRFFEQLEVVQNMSGSEDIMKQIKRGPGRPRYTGERVSKCDVRLNDEENNMLNRLAEDNDVSRSDVMRKALKNFYRWNVEE